MPIKGLTTNVTPQFPILGKIRKGGEKRKNSKGDYIFGEDLDHFRFDCGDNQKLQQLIDDNYGKEPKAITIQLPFENLEDNFPCWLEDYNNNSLVKRCDGETINICLDTKTQQYSKEPKPCVCDPDEPKCKQVGRLKIVLPKIIDAGRIGYFVMETHSKHDIIELNQYLLAIYNSFGYLHGIPMILSRYSKEVSTPYKTKTGEMKRSKSVKSFVRLDIHPQAVKAMRNANVLMPVEDFEALPPSQNKLTQSQITKEEIEF